MILSALLGSLILPSKIQGFSPQVIGRRRKMQVGSSAEDEYSEESSSTPKGRRRPLRRPRSASAEASLETRQEEARQRHAEALKDPALLTKQSFADRKDISPATKRAITEVMGLQRMTEIQARTYAAAFQGQSVLGRARTGTGKTLAFLLPAIERLLVADLDLFKPGITIGLLVVAPTRELAIQIASQADSLLSFHDDMDVACVYGGAKVQRDIRMLSGPRLPTVLVATPGRLLELCEGTRIGKRKFSDIIQETRILVLDEADRLLDGFGREIKQIISYLPRSSKRQTMLFSATASKKLRGFIKDSFNVEFEEVDCLDDRRKSQGETSVRVTQSYLLLDSMADYIPTLASIIQQAKKEDDHKILVFFPASKIVRFFAHFFNIGLEIPVLEIHSRMSQASRVRASNSFRNGKEKILFSSDVSARGVDYPDVTMVLQYGAPQTEDSYVHRIGRTGRAGREGQGILVLLPFEKYRMKKLLKRRLNMAQMVAPVLDKETEQLIKSAQLQIKSGHATLTPNAEAAARAFLAYYVKNSGPLDAAQVLQVATDFALSTGQAEMPSMEAKVVSRLGLEGYMKSE